MKKEYTMRECNRMLLILKGRVLPGHFSRMGSLMMRIR